MLITISAQLQIVILHRYDIFIGTDEMISAYFIIFLISIRLDIIDLVYYAQSIIKFIKVTNMIINLFCDASIDKERHMACAASYIVFQPEVNDTDQYCINPIYRGLIQTRATNNSAEILAVWLGIVEALKLRENNRNAIFRLFSDSKISLYGLRDWIKNWIRDIGPDGVLMSSSGDPVSNQQRFIDCFNLIVENDLKIEFYHQIGHVGNHKLNEARVKFIRANKVSPEALGLDIHYISMCNNIVDNFSRTSLKNYVSTGQLPENVYLEGVHPMRFSIRDQALPYYISNINKVSVKSRHDFKGGYNQ